MMLDPYQRISFYLPTYFLTLLLNSLLLTGAISSTDANSNAASKVLLQLSRPFQTESNVLEFNGDKCLQRMLCLLDY